ncbi:nitric oxide dioxygenase [Streptoalloteichus tenebrarius]|uniref:nitric oxide dioxygenase n=1 Tax=Streptoalloteichus tenebrarius (strain ATCC 17920 / DSM 40477 / JCM 4838 / CBS 697.72 / NBRC 16177 / NCIMB 11028 / NRRL B-12390 / A12253. 1 / ISP 5477) TaxID=1933 RepID=A0ABT1HVE9_STRSD|nr:globin domain-containing protein [Streptoalloteichus tenebrarius]MCP2259502.1 nitric oxide dioxygenase [Streptoalloteichus tenebrarius]BFF01417.1 FAD-binding oxidoreductase [Streptoalloteichus tenebrarius]
MLSEESARVVRATADVVAAHGEEITARFYERMFAAHPELLDLFNRGSQANGEQRQALAGAVVAFAGHIAGLRPLPLGALLSRIAHKHASVGIAPNQYVVVGRHLMAAVAEVLGDAVTPEVAAAWDEVYWAFACMLVAEEARLYERAGSGFERPFHPHRVVRRQAETADVESFWLEPEDGRPIQHRTGQYVSVAVRLPDNSRQIRQYTVSSAPGRGPLRITVKRHREDGQRPAGLVSTHLHDHVRVGDRLLVSPPFGDVVLPQDDSPLLLVTAGIGITPAAAVLDELATHGSAREIVVAHADRSPASHPLAAELLATATGLSRHTVQLWYESDADSAAAPAGVEVRSGLLDPAALRLPAGARVLLCGPLPFMRHVRRGLLDRGVPAERIHYEVFGSDAWLPRSTPAAPAAPAAPVG